MKVHLKTRRSRSYLQPIFKS